MENKVLDTIRNFHSDWNLSFFEVVEDDVDELIFDEPLPNW